MNTNHRRPSRLYRQGKTGKLMGVCAGVGEYFGVDPWLVRIPALFSLFVFTVPTTVGYLVAAWLLPDAPEDLYESGEEASFWRDVRTKPHHSAQGLRHRFRECERRLQALEAYVTSREFGLNRDISSL